MPRNEDSKYRQGKYRPQNPKKYGGDPTNIVYRSSYELKFMQYCDLTENVNSFIKELVHQDVLLYFLPALFIIDSAIILLVFLIPFLLKF